MEITSACEGRHVDRSQHYRGMAADLRPLQASRKRAIAAMKKDPQVGAIILERRNLLHMDLRAKGRHGKVKVFHWSPPRHWGRRHHRRGR